MNRQGFKRLALTGLCVAATVQATAQAQCEPGTENAWVTATAPATDFIAQGDGTVLHHPTRLVWQRCVLGQSWNGVGCDGTALGLNWGDALLAAETDQHGGHGDWRLPNRNEFNAILEARCHGPAVSLDVFPEAPGGGHWTASPFSNAVDQVWIIDLDHGRTEPAPAGSLLFIRLVRTPHR